jgi:sulfite reductase (NADPH) flavoprotein alpha-component
MAKRILFQIHWFLGITAGLVLAVMGVTGASLSFEHEIMEALSPAIYAPGPHSAPDLSPDQLIAKAERAHPGYRVTYIDWQADPERSHGLSLSPIEKGNRLRGQIDRATGAWLGEAPSMPLFETLTRLHRWLALPDGGNGIGRQITGFSAIALIFFALSGLYLRWPRQALDWRAWLVLDLRKTGRNLWRALHVVIGTWVLLFYLLSGFTGLWWSYGWYRQGVTYALTGESQPARNRGGRRDAAPPPNPSIDTAWNAFQRAAPDRYAQVGITISADEKGKGKGKNGGKATARFDALPVGARHERQADRFSYDAASGRQESADRYDRRPLGKVITQSMYELHRGAFFGMIGRIALLLTSLSMPLFTITGYLLYLSRRRTKRAAAALGGAPIDGPADLLIAFASQTGTAELEAHNAAAALAQGGVKAQVLPVGKLTPALLADTATVLFVVSTYGDGEEPDMARGFVGRMIEGAPLDLAGLRYGVLALGDREYVDFCAFGLRVDAWLAASGATPLFDLILMEQDDAAAAAAWHDALRGLGATEGSRGQQAIAYAPWTLVARHELNPGSSAAKAFHLQFEPSAGTDPEWEPGDIVEVQPCNAPADVDALIEAQATEGEVMTIEPALREQLMRSILPGAGSPASSAEPHGLRPLPPREYSAASILADGTLDLVVRRVAREDGGWGIGSGWLTTHMAIGDTTMLRVRPNPGFRVPADGRPLILIGNGTGIAGLRAHLRAASHAGTTGHWLLFGERTRAHESFFDAELAGWQANGILARIDRCFSREADCGRYVQQALAEQDDAVRDWVDRGATILVCGSLEGMAQAVDEALSATLGADVMTELSEEGRYRRDIY